jgi:acetylornithine deacetylase/succinyl-diaminopimelate desuccinylase-like protein
VVDKAWLDELGELLRIPSLSADPQRADDVRAAAQWVADFVSRSGGEAALEDWNGRPLAIGEIPAAQPDAPTVLIYGHFDVQPADPLDLWESDPFEPTVRDEWLYARGVADDKGQLYLLLKAAQLLARDGGLPVNVRVACDGEEEIGGHSIVEYLEADDRGADAAIIFDAGMIRRGVPAFFTATRGMAYFHVRVRTGARDLHSGLYGGAALNATHALMQTLQAVLPRGGRLPEPLRAGLAAPTEQELADWSALPPGTDELEFQGGRPADPKAGEEFYLRTFAEPSVDVHGVEGGSPQLQKTVLPVVAEANLSIRLAPGQQVDVVAPEVERLLREAVPEGAELEIMRRSSAPPGLVPPDARPIQLGLDAFERALGTRPLLLRSGGTLPIVPALVDAGIPTIITGFALPESNIHSPNERMLVEYLPLGVAAARELYVSLGSLR